MLASNAMILQALIEGGWNNEKEDETPDKGEDNDLNDSDNPLVKSILKGSNSDE